MHVAQLNTREDGSRLSGRKSSEVTIPTGEMNLASVATRRRDGNDLPLGDTGKDAVQGVL
jgi:hypothetical protein